ncbi:MAG: nitroreductase family protein [Treponema sp.]|nr:nitroreductase family protein [Treponema sp.]
MNKKTLVLTLILSTIGLSFAFSQTSSDPGLFPIIHNFSARNFTTEPVTRTEIDLLVQAGLRAPSAGNRQPWLFTVVQNHTLANQILPDITQGNILIVISGVGDGRTNGPVILCCALAAQNMFIASMALGLGARQYTNARLIERTNGLKAELGIPEDHSAIIVTRFGRIPPNTDVISSASPRHEPGTKVIFR